MQKIYNNFKYGEKLNINNQGTKIKIQKFIEI